jgi:hypothetical protein
MRKKNRDTPRASGTRRVRKAPPSGAGASGPSTVEEDFGPGFAEEPAGAEGHTRRAGPFPGLACAGEDCLLKPAADLIGKFALSLGRRGHGVSLSRVALSGIDLMKALRDFLDEEIALAEKATGGGARPSRYSKIRVE